MFSNGTYEVRLLRKYIKQIRTFLIYSIYYKTTKILHMKKYSITVLIMLVLMILPYWTGNTHPSSEFTTRVVKRTRKINASLFEARLKHNAELISLKESFEMKEQLTDSILNTRDEQIVNYRQLLGFLESRNRYVIDNGHYIGAYQFGSDALKNVGLGHITRAKYLKNPNVFPDSLQDWAVIELAKQNQKMMLSKINVNLYVGKKIRGIRVTKGGILAAAHLIGWYDCSNYLSTWGKFNPADGNGTAASDYMKKFQDKDIVAFDIENDFEFDLRRIWIQNDLPKITADKIY